MQDFSPDSSQGNIEVTGCWAIFCSTDYRKRRHSHGAHEFIVVLEGEVHSRTRSDILIARAGDVLIFPEGHEHAQSSQGRKPPRLIAVHWRGDSEAARLDKPEVRYDLQGRVRHQTQWLLDIYPSRKSEDQGLIRSLVWSATAELARLRNPSPTDMAERIRRYIREHISEKISLDELAREAHMSKYHFARTLKAATGQTPMRLLSRMRIEEARGLLLQTDLTLEVIADHVGLSDASHLSHLFRKFVGMSPGEFRNAQ